MSPELKEKLYTEFPEIFPQKDGYAMVWGFECGDGWYDLIRTLCKTIQGHINSYSPKDRPPQTEAIQVKEKFGTLRFYTNIHSEFAEGAIEMAAAMSAKICESCGKPGRFLKGGWVKVRCEECE